MPISKKQLEELMNVKPSVEKIATVSSDGRNLLVRIPKDVREFLDLNKGDKLRFLVEDSGKISMNLLRKDAEKKKKRT